MSTTDPDASVTRRGKGRSKLEYQVHRGVDSKCEIITATEVTPGEVHEAHRMQALSKLGIGGLVLKILCYLIIMRILISGCSSEFYTAFHYNVAKYGIAA